MDTIGTINTHGNTVLQLVPDRIRLNDEEGTVLEKYTGASYAMPNVGMRRFERGTIVEPGDYVGRQGEWRSRRWLAQNPTEWTKVR